MGISRGSWHKRLKTGGRQPKPHVKRKFELGRPAAMTRIGATRVHRVRTRGGNLKMRALRLETGNFSWPTLAVTRKTRVLEVVYNASNNELVRTNTLVKGAIISIDATPFRLWYGQHFGVGLGKKKKGEEGKVPRTRSKNAQKLIAKRNKTRELDTNIEAQFLTGRLLARISSRPGQSGRVDGYILEGDELVFYQRKLKK